MEDPDQAEHVDWNLKAEAYSRTTLADTLLTACIFVA